MTPTEWRALGASVSLGAFPLAYEVTCAPHVSGGLEIRIVHTNALDVKTGFPTRIFNVEILSEWQADNMTLMDAQDYLRKRLQDAVLHELDEFLSIGGHRWNPHAKDVKRDG